METTPTSTQVPEAGGGGATPAWQPPQQPTTVYTPPPTQAQPYAQGGQPAPSGSVFSRFFEGITLTDVVVTTLVFTALGLSIYYFRKKIKDDRKEKSSVQLQLDEVTSNVKTALGDQYQEFV